MATKVTNAATGLIDRLFHGRAVARWTAASRDARAAELETLSVQRQRARQLLGKLEEVIHVADSRLALPRIGSNTFPRPPGTQWAWRPDPWRGPLPQKGLAGVPSKTKLGGEVSIFHDCQINELTLRQIRNRREADLAPFGLKLDVMSFGGSFLSLVVDLPPEAAVGLSRKHVIRMNAYVATEQKIEMFARLNIKHGPNTEQITVELPLADTDVMVEFDLAYADINEKRVEGMWLDLIFENPQMNEVELRDMTFCRYPRAAL